jgi:hypothetical protein
MRDIQWRWELRVRTGRCRAPESSYHRRDILKKILGAEGSIFDVPSLSGTGYACEDGVAGHPPIENWIDIIARRQLWWREFVPLR